MCCKLKEKHIGTLHGYTNVTTYVHEKTSYIIFVAILRENVDINKN